VTLVQGSDPPNPLLYEVSAWPWLTRLSRGGDRLVTLANVPPAVWDDLAALGVNVVYLMGVWRRSAIGRSMARSDAGLRREYDAVLPGWQPIDVAGSPFSIAGYEPDPRVGGWDGIDAARAALSARGIRLWLDFIPNHTGFDHPWVSERADLYVQGTAAHAAASPEDFRAITDAGGEVRFIACARDPYFPPWSDVAQLNYFNPETRARMVEVLGLIAAHADGVRCDMAMLVLNDVFRQTWGHLLEPGWTAPLDEFWPGAIRGVASLTYLAEVYWDREWDLQQQGFAYTYDKRLLDRLHTGNALDVRAHLRADAAYASRLARFIENHDEPRSAARLGGRLHAAAATAFTLPGLRFLFDGQIEGARLRAPVQLGRWPQAAPDAAVREFYERLLSTIRTPLFTRGAWRLRDVRDTGDGTSRDLVASTWTLDGQQALVAANLGAADAQGFVEIDVPAQSACMCVDRLTGARYSWQTRDLTGGLYVRIPPGTAQILGIE
jgi:hypothetical protein